MSSMNPCDFEYHCRNFMVAHIRNNQDRFDFDFLQTAIFHFQKELVSPKISETFCDVCMSLFADYHVTNFDVIAKVLELYIEVKQKRKPCINFPKCCLRRCNGRYSCLSYHPHSSYMDYLIRKEFEHLDLHSIFPIPANEAFESDQALFKTLMRYGVPLVLPSVRKVDAAQVIADILNVFSCTSRGFSPLDISFLEIDHLRELRLNATNEFVSKSFRRRQLLILRLLKSIAGKINNVPDADVNIECMKLVFETIPDHFVTTKEIDTMINRILSTHSERKQIEKKFRQTYIEVFGNIEHTQPRTLKHLSRCQVRQDLAESGILPHGVSSLRWPERIKKYVLLNE